MSAARYGVEHARRLHRSVDAMCTTCGKPATPHPYRHPVTLLRRPTPAPVRWWTVAEVAADWRVSKMTVYRLLDAGELRGHRFGRSWRVSQEALDAYASGAEVQLGIEGDA